METEKYNFLVEEIEQTAPGVTFQRKNVLSPRFDIIFIQKNNMHDGQCYRFSIMINIVSDIHFKKFRNY